MLQVEMLAKVTADKISTKLTLDNDQKEVIAYGAFALIQTILSILFVILLGSLFNVALEAVVISFIVSILRKYSGGIHASTSNACMIIGTVIFVGLAKMLTFMESSISVALTFVVVLISFSWCYHIILKLAPVESVTKPISNQKRKRMKKGSIITLSVYLTLVLINIMFYYVTKEDKLLGYCLCICVGSAWQVFTLTKVGHRVLSKIDIFLNHILSFKGGK
jgi:accessory gene regulator B